MEHLIIRRAESKDVPEVAEMFHCLWPKASVDQHADELAALLAGSFPQQLPDIVLLAEQPGGRVVGFIEVDLRSHADGCNPSRPVGYIEEWYVAPTSRRRESEQGLLPQPRTGLEHKDARGLLLTHGWMPSTRSVLTKHSGSRSWIAAYIIGRVCDLDLSVSNRRWKLALDNLPKRFGDARVERGMEVGAEPVGVYLGAGFD